MNMAYYKELQRKELIKNSIFIVFILLFAVISTYYIYNKFVDKRDEILRSDSLEVSFHEKDGNHFSIEKLISVSDNVGLSSKAYRFTIQNNTNTKVKYVIRIAEDLQKILDDNCMDNKIPLNVIKMAIHGKNQVSSISNLDDFIDGNILIDTIDPRQKVDYTMRFWVSNHSLVLDNINYHYHGIIQVDEFE